MECSGKGFVGLWRGYGGGESFWGDTKTCEECGGSGEEEEEE